MKLEAFILIKVICEKKGWIPKSEIYSKFKNDACVRFYYNSGKPYLNCLIEYYYNIYIAWLNNGGDTYDYISEFNDIYEEHSDECDDGDPWKKSYSRMHKLYLLKWDYFWYKRHFRKLYIYKIENYSLFKGKKLRKLRKSDLIRFRDKLTIEGNIIEGIIL